MKLYSVRLSHSPAAAGLMLWARHVRDIDRLLHGRRRRRTSTGPQHGAQQQMRAVSCFQRT